MKFRLFLILMLTLASSSAVADVAHFETEPNNKPEEFNQVSGAVTLYGNMTGGDQDGYAWTVSDDGARKRWSFELHGIPGALTITQVVKLEYADNGVDVVGKTNLMKMGTRDGSRPSIHEGLIFEPGEYVLGMASAGSKSGNGASRFRPPVSSLSFGEEPGTSNTMSDSDSQQGAYRFLIHEQSMTVSKNPGPRDSMDTAYSIRLGREFATYETERTVWYQFDFDEKDAESHWDIRVQVPVGRKLSAALYAEDGQKLLDRSVDQKGRLRLPGLTPPVGTWFLKLQASDPGFIHYVNADKAGARVAGQEAEPNNGKQIANHVDFTQPLVGHIGEDDKDDYFRFEVDEAAEDQLHALRIASSTPGEMNFCLMSPDWNRAQCRAGVPPFQLQDLLLPTGTWGIHISRSDPQDYSITLEPQGPIETGREVEPNDTPAYASGVSDKMRIKGRFDGNDTDIYQFILDGEAQLWRFQVNGSGVRDMAYLNSRGQQRAVANADKGQNRLVLDNLFLLPGRHMIKVRGENNENYTLLARPLGPPVASEHEDQPDSVTESAASASEIQTVWNPDTEIEPNDQHNIQRLAIGQVRTGTLPDKSDEDHYRFFVANHDHLRITIESPEDGTVLPYLNWYQSALGAADKREPGEVITWQGLLPPGDYTLKLVTQQPSDKPYRLKLERLPRFACKSDCEPSGIRGLDLVSPIPNDLVLEGVVGDWRDTDDYQFPAFEQDTEVFLRTAVPVSDLKLIDSRGTRSSAYRHNPELGGYQLTVPSGEAQRLTIRGTGQTYRMEMEFPGGEILPVKGNIDTELLIEFDHARVAAFLEHGQQLNGKLTIQNVEAGATELTLTAVTSDHRWSVVLQNESAAVGAGEQLEIPVTVWVPSDAWSDQAVRISIRAMDSDGQHVETWAEIQVGRNDPPVNPVPHWPIPKALRGSFNAAWAPFGAVWTTDTPDEMRDPELRDNLVFPSATFSCCRGTAAWEKAQEPAWTIKLPGDSPFPVAGVAIENFGSPAIHSKIQRATFLLSDDGVNFTEALRFEALPVLTEQQFALESPVPARYARLQIDSTFELPHKEITAGEWKVLLQPGEDLSSGRGFNIADPQLGGHVAWTWPPDSSIATVLVNDDKPTWAVLEKGPTVDYIIGFHRNRAAQISLIEWEYHQSSAEENRNFARVNVFVSSGSPIGPWEEIGSFALTDTENAAELKISEPVWGRFVKLTAHLDESETRSMEPGVIRIWERPTGADYFSVLTEWGEAGSRAFYETLEGIPEATTLASGNDARSKAAPIEIGQRASGAVKLGELEHWYKITVPQNQNVLRFELTGDPTVRAVLELRDVADNRLPLSPIRSGRSPRRHIYEAIVEPGSEVWIRVNEPPRNVIFSWDTSGSVAAYVPRINNAVVAFSGQVQPDLEWVNLLPFGKGMLMKQWSDQPYHLQSVLNDYREIDQSSAAEKTLHMASRALANRPGTKSVVIVTDAVTPYYGEMWEEMAKVQPRIFGIGVAGGGITEQNRFRDWAEINGGDYQQLRYLGEMDVAFDRAATRMQRPAGYSFLVEGEFREAPGPGNLVVIAGEAHAQAAVELILDASGSMLQRVEGKRRINVAKEVLTEAVREYIPAGTPVALRVFGHKEVDACRTDLEIPLGPLNPDNAAETIASVNAMNLARTPIADSLAAVETDLEGAKSGAVVLVTDGEETCDGNPAEVIKSLREKGFNVNLNIVGFAINDEELAAQFESWAEMGQGRYFPADNQDGLSAAIETALKIPFIVYDRGGNEVATGQINSEPLELERGIYSVLVRSQPPRRFDDVDIRGEDQVVLELE